jgi:S1-C subfamily serine protease
LLDAEGRVVGINTAIFFPAQGLCFAVPSNTASFVLGELLRHGRVRRGYLGIGVEEVLLPAALARVHGIRPPSGVAVRVVMPGGPAASAGLRGGDVLVSLGGAPLRTVADLHRTLGGEAIGARLEVEVLRSGSLARLTVAPVEHPKGVKTP